MMFTVPPEVDSKAIYSETKYSPHLMDTTHNVGCLLHFQADEGPHPKFPINENGVNFESYTVDK